MKHAVTGGAGFLGYHVLQATPELGSPRVVHISTTYVYGISHRSAWRQGILSVFKKIL